MLAVNLSLSHSASIKLAFFSEVTSHWAGPKETIFADNWSSYFTVHMPFTSPRWRHKTLTLVQPDMPLLKTPFAAYTTAETRHARPWSVQQQNCSCPWGSRPHLTHGSWVHKCHPPNAISISSAVYFTVHVWLSRAILQRLEMPSKILYALLCRDWGRRIGQSYTDIVGVGVFFHVDAVACRHSTTDGGGQRSWGREWTLNFSVVWHSSQLLVDARPL